MRVYAVDLAIVSSLLSLFNTIHSVRQHLHLERTHCSNTTANLLALQIQPISMLINRLELTFLRLFNGKAFLKAN